MHSHCPESCMASISSSSLMAVSKPDTTPTAIGARCYGVRNRPRRYTSCVRAAAEHTTRSCSRYRPTMLRTVHMLGKPARPP